MSYQADVIGKPFTSNDTNNGGKVVYTSGGKYKSTPAENKKIIAVAAVFTKLDTRFDDTNPTP